MARWENHSGSAVSVPVVNRDVDDGEVVDVPDDVVLPSNYFRLVGEAAPAEAVPAYAAPIEVTLTGEGE